MSGHNHLHDGYNAPGVVTSNTDGEELGDLVDRTPLQIALVTAGAETRTLEDPPKAGLELTLNMKTDGGDCVVTAATAINATGNNTLTFGAVTDVCVLKSIESGSSLLWRIVGNDGVGLSTV